MHPILFEVGGFTIYSYGVLLAAAYLIGLQFARIRARARGLDAQLVMDLGIWIIVSALIGARLLLFLVDFRQFTASARDVMSIARSGGVFYGGLIAAVVVAFWYIRRYQMPVWTTTDVFAPGIALGHAVGRMGCLLAGCCFGRETSVPWAITFHNPVAAANVGTPLGVPLHPTQVYEAVAELMILGLLLVTERRGRQFAGRTFWGYMLLYGITRFVIEFYRGDPRGFLFGAISTSQFVSLILVPVAILMLYALGRRPQPSPLEAAGSMRAA
jgi:phosphatidylglycerol:prolipoprotein diacylglycerol transferase